MNYNGILKFKWTWRAYQERVLKNADKYIKDGKVHIVAAPGSGKTTVGIEFIRRMNEKVLILAPSVTIREQWVSRIKEGFLCEGVDADSLISQNLKEPKAITVATYQALHSAMIRYKGTLGNEEDPEAKKEEEEVDFSDFALIQTMKKHQLGLLCLDECHHLRSEWWKALEAFRKECGELKVIALTATPPYDSNPAMWKRYMDMCGEIDEEITVPELVKEGSLCPHQDYVYFNYPTEEEQKEIEKFKQRSAKMVEALFKEQELVEAISSHASLTGVMASEKLYEDKAYLKAFLTYLKNKKVSMPNKLSRMADGMLLPKMDAFYMEKLLQGFLYDDADAYAYKEEYSEQLENRLKAEGLIEKKKVTLSTNEAVEKMLIQSKGKANSIRDIVFYENKMQGEQLRLLILTDYIRKEYEKALGKEEADINALGVLPFFEMLRREATEDLKLAVLCGTLVIIPTSAKEALEKEIEGKGTVHFGCVGALEETEYVKVEAVGDAHFLTSAITALFTRGYIRVLIGTKSLLGEGWDAPCVNTLILASFVGSYMLSNQMRGRAIRVFKDNPEKCSNIWHLVCLKPWEKADKEDVSEDFVLLERRMEHFMGLHYTEDQITSGMERLSYILPPYDEKNVAEINQKMLTLSAQRKDLKTRWNTAVTKTKKMEIAEETCVKDEALTDKVWKQAKNKAMLGAGGTLALGIASALSGGLLGTLMGLASVYSAIKTAQNIPKLVTLNTPVKRLRACGMGIRKAMMSQGMLQSKDTTVAAESNNEKATSVYLCGGTSYEKTIFASCVKEFFAEIEDQRYLLVKKRNRKAADSFYSVPEIFAKKKEDAEAFRNFINPYIGDYELVYTRNERGKELLLEGKLKSLETAEKKSIQQKVYK